MTLSRQGLFSIDGRGSELGRIKLTHASDIYTLHAECQPDEMGKLPIIDIYESVDPLLLKRIPEQFTSVCLRAGVDKDIVRYLPTHIKEVHIFPGINLNVFSGLSPTVTQLKFTGAGAEILQNIPPRFGNVYLENDISAAAIRCLPQTVEVVYLTGPISAETLRHMPATVRGVYFSHQSCSAELFYDDQGILQNVAALLLKALPKTVNGVGMFGDMNKVFLAHIPPTVQSLVFKSVRNSALAREIPPHVTQVIIARDIGEDFIMNVPMHCHIICINSASQQQKEIVARANGRIAESRTRMAATQSFLRLTPIPSVKREREADDGELPGAPPAKRFRSE